MDNIREKLVELLSGAVVEQVFCSSDGHPVSRLMCRVVDDDDVDGLADYLLANGVTVQTKKEKPPVDLTNKCGSCKHSVLAEGVFGDSTCYVRCTNEEHLNSRSYQGRPLIAVRQRTAKTCKKYEPKGE